MYGPGIACNLVKGHTSLGNHGLHTCIIARNGFCLQAVIWRGQRLAIQTFKLQHVITVGGPASNRMAAEGACKCGWSEQGQELPAADDMPGSVSAAQSAATS
jgi:hypothetical protein